MKPLKILFFINDSNPSLDHVAEAEKIGHQVCFRNAAYIPVEGALEACDGVTGEVPKRYAEAFPTAEVAVEKRHAEIEALRAKVGDSPAPSAPVAPVPADPAATDAATGAQDGAGAGDDAKATAPGADAAPAPTGHGWSRN